MALVFLNVDYTSGNVLYAGYSPPWQDNHSAYTTTLDDSVAGVKDLLSNVNAHIFTSVVGTNPYIKANYDGTNLNATLVNGTAPAQVTLSILGTTYTCSVTNCVITFPISVHASVQNSRIPVSIIASGFPTTAIEIGGSNGNVQTQMYKDTTGTYHVVPQNDADLVLYWTMQSFNAAWQPADIATITMLNAYVLFHYVLPALQNAAYTPVNLSVDEKNGVSDIQTNILSNVPVDLAHIAPVPATGQEQSFDTHYSSFRSHIQNTHTVMTNYVNDRNTITQYTTLK